MAILTSMRQAAWNAIETWPALQGVFKRKWKFEDANSILPKEIMPSIGEMPAIAIYPAPSESPWVRNQDKEFRYVLNVEVWRAHWNLLDLESDCEEIAKALFQGHAGGTTVPFIKAATGQYPEVNSFNIERVLLADENKAVKLTLPVTIKYLAWNPITATS